MSVRTRLVAFALLCAVPVFTLAVLHMRSDGAHLRQHAQESARAANEQLVLRLANLLNTSEAVAHAMGAVDSTPSNAAACSRALARALAPAGPSVRNYTMASRTGAILCTAAQATPGMTIGDRPHFQQAVQLRRPVLSGLVPGKMFGGEPLLTLVVPTVDGEGRVDQVASIALRPEALTAGLADSGDLPTTVMLFDRAGTLVSSSSKTPGLESGRSYADTPLFRRVAAGMPEPVEMPGADGRPMLHVAKPVVYHGEPVLWVVSAVDVGPLEAAVRATHLRHLLVTLALAAAVVAIAVMATRPLVLARVGNLLHAARQVAHGDYGRRVPVLVRDDVTPVEEAFNHMLAAVEADRAVLAASENRFRKLFENSIDGVLETTPDGAILAANPAACRLLGRDEAQLKALRRSDVVDLEDPRLPALLRQRSELGWARGELRMLRGDGTAVEVAIASSLYEDSTGRLRTCLVIHDNTERREAQEQILRLNRELEARVNKRTQELQAANRELEAFSYSVSHDLRGPAGVVQAFAGVLEENGAVQGDKNRHYLSRIRAAGQRMNELIDGLLALAQVSRSQLEWSLVDLGQLAREALQELRDGEPGREVAVEIAPGLHAMGDVRLLRVVVTNLLGNAWKFTRRTAQPRIRIGLEGTPGEGPVFSIRDNGDGFEPSQAARLFLPFHRLHAANEFPGVGIGLATVQRIVQRHGGRIWADASPGAGASFFFTLGAQEPVPEQRPTRPAAAS